MWVRFQEPLPQLWRSPHETLFVAWDLSSHWPRVLCRGDDAAVSAVAGHHGGGTARPPPLSGLDRSRLCHGAAGRLWKTRWTRGALAEFHESYSLTLQAHSAAAEGRLRDLLSAGGPKRGLRAAYETEFHRILDRPASRAKHVRVLKTIVDRIAADVSRKASRVLRLAVRDYQAARIPRVEVVSVLRHYARLVEDEALTGSNYLVPDPREWILRLEVGQGL